MAVAYSTTLSMNAPPIPMPASNRPPKVGPTIRLALPAPTSSAIAVAIRSRPTTSPIIMRRKGLSVAQPQPLTKLATASCQTSSVNVQTTTDSAADVMAIKPIRPTNGSRRSNISAKAPRKAPNRAMGSSRSMVIAATTKALLVC